MDLKEVPLVFKISLPNYWFTAPQTANSVSNNKEIPLLYKFT